MSEEGDPDQRQFVRVEGDQPITRAAFILNSFAAVIAQRDGHPGFVTEEYLNSISAETTLAAAELELVGMWERVDGGYVIRHRVVGMVAEAWERFSDWRQS